MAGPRADLHTHTTYSDGWLEPAELVRKVAETGLDAVAVTDHDTFSGLPAAMDAGDRYGIQVIPGVELSVTVDDEEVHLLGYGFDAAHEGLREVLQRMKEGRDRRARAMAERLRALGVDISWDAVRTEAQGDAIGRPHVAAVLVAGGHVDDWEDAFERYLKKDRPAYVAKPRFPARQALALLHDAGGVGVLAHPGHWMATETIHRLIDDGMDGIETVHPSHDKMLVRYYRAFARSHGLIVTGGSDYHGRHPREEERLGQYTVPLPELGRFAPAA